MKLAHVSDTHITEHDPHTTLMEQVDWLTTIGQAAANDGAAVLLHGGDVFDAATTPIERNAAIQVFTAWAELIPVIVVAGNHDRRSDLYYLSRIRSRHQIKVFEAPDVVDVAGATVAALPWPRKSHLVASLGSTSGLEIHEAAAQALRAILLGFRMAFEQSRHPTVLLSHAELGGAVLDSGQPVVGRCDVLLHEHDLLDTGADYIALGHIHKSQTLSERIRYPGSYRPTAFGQEEDKGWSLVEVERGRAPVVTHRRAPYRELVTVEARWIGSQLRVPSNGGEIRTAFSGAAMRLMYEVPASDRAAAAVQASALRDRWLGEGAHSVRLDPRVIATHRVRSTGIRTARTTSDRLEAYWTARNERPARAAAILDKLRVLEEAAA